VPRPNRIVLIAVALVAGCAAPAGSGLPGPPGPASASPSAKPVCPLDGFSLSTGETEGALGLRAMPVDLVNCGKRTITLNGYPGVRLADAGGKTITFALKQGVRAVAMIDEWDKPPSKVTVKPGQAAVALLVWRGTTEITSEGPQTATILRVSVKDGVPYRLVKIAGPIDLGTTGKLAVSPWRLDEQHSDRDVPTVEPSTDPPIL
jgi:hypothetical protein